MLGLAMHVWVCGRVGDSSNAGQVASGTVSRKPALTNVWLLECSDILLPRYFQPSSRFLKLEAS